MNTAAPTPGRARPASIAALMTALLAACVAFQLNASMLSPALVTIGRELGADQGAIGLSQSWFFTAAALFALFLPRLSDIAGRRKVLLGMMTAMIVGAVICALAPNVAWLFVGRIVAGACGPTVPLCLLMLRSEVTDNVRLGTLMGLVAAVNGGIAGIDAFAGGWLAEHHGFRSLFWVMAGCGVVALVLVAALTRESRPNAAQRMDWSGVVCLVVGVGALLTALNEITSALEAGPRHLLVALPLVLVSVVALGAFWRVEGRVAEPMVRREHLRRRATWATLATTTCTMGGIFAVINGIVPAYVQSTDPGFGVGATVTSLAILTPYALVGWIVGPFAGRYAPLVGYTRLLRLGLVASAAALAVMATLGLASLTVMIAAAVALGIAYAGVANIVLNNLGVVHSPPGNPGFLPGMNSGAFNLGAGLSFLVLPATQVAVTATVGPQASYVVAIGTGVALLAVAFVLSLFIPAPVEAEERTDDEPQETR